MAMPELAIAFLTLMVAAVVLGIAASSSALGSDQGSLLVSILGGPVMIGGAALLYGLGGARLMDRFAPSRTPSASASRERLASGQGTMSATVGGRASGSNAKRSQDGLIETADQRAAPSAIGVLVTHVLFAIGGSIILGMLLRLFGAAPQEQGRIVALTSKGLDANPEAIALIVSALVLAPLAEEFFFRVLLFDRLALRCGESLAYLGSSLVFAVVHFNPSGMFTYLWLGLVFAHAYRRSGRIWVPVAVHAANNAVTLVILFSMPAPSSVETGLIQAPVRAVKRADTGPSVTLGSSETLAPARHPVAGGGDSSGRDAQRTALQRSRAQASPWT